MSSGPDAKAVDMEAEGMAAHRRYAKASNGRVWELLEKAERNAREDDELLYAAFASCWHWLQVGTDVEQQRGEYLVAKAYISLGRRAEALAHARKCLALTERGREAMEDFDVAFAYEILARAYAMQGEIEQAEGCYERARTAGAAIKDPEDRTIFEKDVAAPPWFGLQRK